MLLGRLREGLALLTQSGRLKEISDKWLGSLERETTVGGPTVRIGVLANRGTDKCRQKWGLTVDYLNGAIDGYIFKLVPLDFEEIAPAVEEGKVEFILANSAFYVTLEARYGANRIATLKNRVLGNVHTTFGGVIFTRAERDDIQDLADLKGKSFMAVKETSFGGWQMAWQEFKERGIDPRSDFAELRFGGTHDAVVRAVRDGKVDAGAVRTDTLERMAAEGKIRLEDFHVLGHEHTPEEARQHPFLHSTDMYPEWPMAKVAHTTDTLAEEVAGALIHMPADSPAAGAGHYAGWTIPHSYQPVHKLLKELRVGPYKDFGKITLRDVLMQYWPWIVSAIALLAAMTVLLAWVLRLLRQRKRAEEGLQQSEQKYRELVENTNTIILRMDPEGKVTFFNEYAQEFFGYSEEEILGENVIGTIVPETESTGRDLAATIPEIARNTEQYETHENESMRKNGERVWISWTNQVIRDEDGRVSETLCVGQDASDRKQAEKRVQKEYAKLSAMISVMDEGVVFADADNRIIEVNEYFCKFTKTPREKIIGETIESFHQGNVLERINKLIEKRGYPLQCPKLKITC